jgi:hypothetical protein
MSSLLINELLDSNKTNLSSYVLRKDELNKIYGGGVTVENCKPAKIEQRPDGTVIITCK